MHEHPSLRVLIVDDEPSAAGAWRAWCERSAASRSSA